MGRPLDVFTIVVQVQDNLINFSEYFGHPRQAGCLWELPLYAADCQSADQIFL